MKKIVVFTGAGVSKESGIETFRDGSGSLWNNYSIEDVATPSGWRKNRELVLDFYNARRAEIALAKPNIAHELIASLDQNYDVTVITQNVDDLHERAGSTNIIHLHGELTKARGCMYLHKSSPLDNIVDIGYNDIKIGDKCEVTGSQLRPHIVWFGEDLDPNDLYYSTKAASECDICIIIGTSMQVYPASEIPFLTPDDCKVFCVDPNDLGFYIPEFRKPFFHHIKEPATIGIQKVIEAIKGI